MRIHCLVHLMPPRHNAGAEWMLVSMLRPLVERGHDVEVLLSRPTPDVAAYDLHGITVHPLGEGIDPRSFVAAADVVITHLENAARASVLCLTESRPLIQVIHNTHWLTRKFLRPAATTLAVFNSVWMAEDFAEYVGASMIVRPPVFADDYRTTPGDAVTLVNLNEDKGAHLFYELAERLPDARFLGVVGGYGDQIIRRDLPNVEIRPHGSDMREVYGSTRVLLAPSSYESWGRVAVEAMCSGIPVIAHPTPGLTECLGGAGFLADRDDPDAWVRHLRALEDPGTWRSASERALARSVELDPADDLRRWCEAVEQIGRAHGSQRRSA